MFLISIFLIFLLVVISQCEFLLSPDSQNVISRSVNGTNEKVSDSLLGYNKVNLNNFSFNSVNYNREEELKKDSKYGLTFYTKNKTGRLRTKRNEERIIGGTPLKAGDMPSYVVILILNHQVCGGNIITERHVLTAAHCVTTKYKKGNGMSYVLFKPELLKIRLGSTFANKEGIKNYASDIRVHPDYLTHVAINEYRDVAVIILWYKVEFNFFIKPAKLHSELNETEVDEMAGTSCTVAGWGKTETGSTSKGIMKTQATLVAHNICKTYYIHRVDPRVHICALDKGRGPCHGDSGGGLFCNGRIIALVSWSFGCATGNPGVYSRVDNAQDFINTAAQRSLTHLSITTPVFITFCVNYFSYRSIFINY